MSPPHHSRRPRDGQTPKPQPLLTVTDLRPLVKLVSLSQGDSQASHIRVGHVPLDPTVICETPRPCKIETPTRSTEHTILISICNKATASLEKIFLPILCTHVSSGKKPERRISVCHSRGRWSRRRFALGAHEIWAAQRWPETDRKSAAVNQPRKLAEQNPGPVRIWGETSRRLGIRPPVRELSRSQIVSRFNRLFSSSPCGPPSSRAGRPYTAS